MYIYIYIYIYISSFDIISYNMIYDIVRTTRRPARDRTRARGEPTEIKGLWYRVHLKKVSYLDSRALLH